MLVAAVDLANACALRSERPRCQGSASRLKADGSNAVPRENLYAMIAGLRQHENPCAVNDVDPRRSESLCANDADLHQRLSRRVAIVQSQVAVRGADKRKRTKLYCRMRRSYEASRSPAKW